jgi:hypothetical protein
MRRRFRLLQMISADGGYNARQAEAVVARVPPAWPVSTSPSYLSFKPICLCALDRSQRQRITRSQPRRQVLSSPAALRTISIVCWPATARCILVNMSFGAFVSGVDSRTDEAAGTT